MKVTIAIPFYNAEEFLADSIRSVFAQTYSDWELILIDDGSTDKSLEIAQSVNDNRVRVISDGLNKKLAARLNEITHLAKYDYIARMDADDLMLPQRIETQINIFKKNPNMDVISTGVYSTLNDLTLIGVRGYESSDINFDSLINKRTGIVHAAVIAKKSWYERNKYDEKLSIAQDYDLWLRTSKEKDLRAMTIEKPLYIYREENNVNANKILRALKNERNMYVKYIDNRFMRFKFLFMSNVKSFIINILDKFGLIKILQKKRNSKEIPKVYFDEYKTAIEVIKKTNVNGLIK